MIKTQLKKFFRKAAFSLLIASSSGLAIDATVRHLKSDPVTLMPGDIDMLEPVYGHSIDYSKVRVHFNRFSVLQPPDKIVTIGNHIYATGDNHLAEKTFLHEMAHVWQNQNGIEGTGVIGAISLWLTSGKSYEDSYGYTLESGKILTHYNMEQQANLLQRYNSMKLMEGAMTSQHPPIPAEKIPTAQEFFAATLRGKLFDKTRRVWQKEFSQLEEIIRPCLRKPSVLVYGRKP